MRSVSDSDTIRRQNRGLVLDAIRRGGPLSRTQIATATGLSHATITAISGDMIAQSILTGLSDETGDQRMRGRPAIRIGFNRIAGYAVLMEVDVNKARCSLVDYSGTLVDRVETRLQPDIFRQNAPGDFLIACIERIRERNCAAADRLMRIGISVQGILDRESQIVKWSPVPGFAGHNLAAALEGRFNLPVSLFKRGRLLAEGARWLFPEVEYSDTATVFIGSTVAMGMSLTGGGGFPPRNAGTEFGHMNHTPEGALCRCGKRGCIEAYAADYGVLRTAYGVPERTPPAPAVPASQFDQLIAQAQQGDRNVIHAFNMAGRALGFGLNRLMAVFDPAHILLVGPGTKAFHFMHAEMESAMSGSLSAHVHGIPKISTHEDESEPVFKGLVMKALTSLDQTEFAALPAASSRGGEK